MATNQPDSRDSLALLADLTERSIIALVDNPAVGGFVAGTVFGALLLTTPTIAALAAAGAALLNTQL